MLCGLKWQHVSLMLIKYEHILVLQTTLVKKKNHDTKNISPTANTIPAWNGLRPRQNSRRNRYGLI